MSIAHALRQQRIPHLDSTREARSIFQTRSARSKMSTIRVGQKTKLRSSNKSARETQTVMIVRGRSDNMEIARLEVSISDDFAPSPFGKLGGHAVDS
jgi:Spy/CpxP family protein refolding chaperone